MKRESVFTLILKGIAVPIPFHLKGYNLFVVSIFRQKETCFSLIPPHPTYSHTFPHIPPPHDKKRHGSRSKRFHFFIKCKRFLTGVNVNAYNLFTNTKLKFNNTIPNERLPLLVRTTA